MRSTDGGESWSDCSDDLVRLAAAEPRLRSKLVSDTEAEGMLDGHAICTSAADPDSVIIAVRMGLFRSRDQGRSWEDMRVDRFSPFTYGRDIKVSPHDPNMLYACLSVAASSKDGALYRSKDIGKTRQSATARHADVGQSASRRSEAGLCRRALWRGIRHVRRRRKLACDAAAARRPTYLRAGERLKSAAISFRP